MSNQLAQTKSQASLLMAIATVVLVSCAGGVLGIYLHERSDPYISEVLVLPGDATRGRAIFTINCAGCHGGEANGNVGPSLLNISKRKSKSRIILQVISGNTPPMPKFQPKPQDMADLLSYLEEL